MMKIVVAAALFGALTTMSAGAASAASLGLTAAAAPVISGQGEALNDPFDPITNPIGFGFGLFGAIGGATSTMPTATGLTVNANADFDFVNGALFVTDALGSKFLSGDLIDVGFTTSNEEFTDTIELLFGNLDGSAAGSFGMQVLLTLFGEFGMEGDDPITNGFASFDDPAFVSFSIAPVAAIPLPASAPLLLTALVGAGFFARRRRSS